MMGFRDLSLQSLDQLIERYERALASNVNYPLGVSHKTVEGWLIKAQAEFDRR